MILLDTQTLFWYLTADPKLGRNASRILRNAPDLHFSSLSILELEIKFFDRAHPSQRVVLSAAVNHGLKELRPTGAELERVSDYPSLNRHDPFDRALLMQASWHNADLYTSDVKLLSLDLPWIKDSQN